jgi:hypothetical protein
MKTKLHVSLDRVLQGNKYHVSRCRVSQGNKYHVSRCRVSSLRRHIQKTINTLQYSINSITGSREDECATDLSKKSDRCTDDEMDNNSSMEETDDIPIKHI